MDLYCTVPINIAQATLGSKLRVRTVDGKRVVLHPLRLKSEWERAYEQALASDARLLPAAPERRALP
jgi:hypothetical protein